MRMKMILKHTVVFVTCLFLALSALSALSALLPGQVYAAEQGGGTFGGGTFTSVSELEEARIGVQTGTSFDKIIEEKLPDAHKEYYNNKADLLAALTGRKIDAFIVDEPVARLLLREHDGITDPRCDIRRVRQRMGMVFQSFNLFGHMTVIENIMFSPMELKKVSRQAAYDRGMELLRMVGLEEKALNYPDELSGGQKQRVAIARTLAMDPEIILLDEPTSALDPTMVDEVQAVIRELSGSGKTMMIVTHEMNFARAISNRVFFMYEGSIYEEGTPEQIFDHPRREQTRRFIQKLKVLEFCIERKGFDFVTRGSEIDRYCSQNGMPSKEKFRLFLSLEELVQQILLPRTDWTQIHVVVQYSAQEKQTVLEVTYNGRKFDPRETGNELSRTVLQNTADEIRYCYDPDSDEPNRVMISIRH